MILDENFQKVKQKIFAVTNRVMPRTMRHRLRYDRKVIIRRSLDQTLRFGGMTHYVYMTTKKIRLRPPAANGFFSVQ